MRALHLIWHSRTGAIGQMVHAIEQDLANHELVRLRTIRAEDARAEHVLQAHALLLMAPENLGSLSGAMKEFFDRNYYACLDQSNGKAYASVIAAGSDGSGAERQLDRICTGLRLKRVSEGLIICTHAQNKAQIEARKQLTETQIAPAILLARTLAEGLALGVF